MNIDILVKNRLARVKLLLSDVDGVMTDGSLLYDKKGYEIKKFNVKDGLGIKFLINSNINVGLITSRCSSALIHRCNDLKITYLLDSIKDKGVALNNLLKKINISSKEIIFVGDDLSDLPAMSQVGISIAVNDADKLVKKNAHIVTFSKGGEGAIREISEIILKAKGMWQNTIKCFLN